MDKTTAWNLSKPGGWDDYERLTNRRAGEVNQLVDKEDISIDQIVKRIINIENEIKFEAFGKTRTNRKKTKRITKEKGVTEEVANKDLIKKQSKRIEEEVIKIKSQKLGRVGNIFKMKEVITGPKKGSQVPTAIRNPATGDLVVSNEEIKNVTLAYCVANLTNKSSEVNRGLELKEYLHKKRMEEMDEEECDIATNDFKGVLDKFSKKKTKSYDFILNAGDKFKDSIFKLCTKMISKAEFPVSFRKTMLHMIWKGKGPAEILKNSRFIHMKEWYLPRTVEALVVSKMKECILRSSSKYQVGGQPGHSPEEHIYTIKSLWAMLLEEGLGLILTLVDIISFFDRENIYDVMQTLHEIGVNKKAAKVWFMLNEGTEIAVKTAGGVSTTAYVGDCIGQGTAGGALVSQANLDRGLEEYFGDSKEEIHYGTVKIQPLAYQDDVLKGSKDAAAAQVGNIKIAKMLEDKGLEAHPDKTSYIVCGPPEFKQKVKEDMQKNPLVFGNFEVKEKESDKYLGQVLHGGGLSESALATVKERAGRIKGATFEIKSIIEEFQMQTLGGMCETRMVGMKSRIWPEKILLLMRIKRHGHTMSPGV